MYVSSGACGEDEVRLAGSLSRCFLGYVRVFSWFGPPQRLVALCSPQKVWFVIILYQMKCVCQVFARIGNFFLGS